MDILKEVKNYYDTEYKETNKAILSAYFKPIDIVDNTIQRCLGVALFVQYLDISFDDINKLYEAQRKRLKNLLKG